MKIILYSFLTIWTGIVGYLLYFHIKNPQVYFFAYRKGKDLFFQYDHDFSSNSFDSIEIEYMDENLTKTINVIDYPVRGKNVFIITDFNPHIDYIYVTYSLNYDRLAPSIMDGKEKIFIKKSSTIFE